MTKSLPRVDVLISTFNEERYVGRCLDAVITQDYPRELISIWLVDGGSTDGTVETARQYAARDGRINLIADGTRLNLPEALNLGIARCDAEIVVKIDAHGYPDRSFVRLAVEDFAAHDSGLACVGGRPLQQGETRFGRALAIARTSRYGVGASGYACNTNLEFVDTVQCGAYRRSALLEVGAFDPQMNYGEDEEANWRLRNAGYRILLDSRIRFHYFTRPTWGSAFRQYRNYGRARAAVVRKHPSFLRPYHLAPAALVGVLGLLVALSLFSAEARLALVALLGLYWTLAVAAAFAARIDHPRLLAETAAAFSALHLGYGVGLLDGCVSFSKKAPSIS